VWKNSKKIGDGIQAGIKKLTDISKKSGWYKSYRAKAQDLSVSVEILQADVEIVQADADEMDLDEDAMDLDVKPQSLMDAISSEEKVCLLDFL
jgi:hypothetical protein